MAKAASQGIFWALWVAVLAWNPIQNSAHSSCWEPLKRRKRGLFSYRIQTSGLAFFATAKNSGLPLAELHPTPANTDKRPSLLTRCLEVQSIQD